MSGPRVSDIDWIRRSFQIPRRATGVIDRRRTLMTTASQKFSDTSLGGNAAINCAPQFTPTADLRVKGRYNKSTGMGRYYSEAHDDSGVILHIRAGVPQYNSLLKFWSGAFNYKASTLAATGRHPGIFHAAGHVLGFIVTLPLQPIIFGIKGISYLMLGGNRSTRYYNLKPTMPLYWTAVQKMVNAIAVNMGVVPPPYGGADEVKASLDMVNDSQFLTDTEVNQYHEAMPDIFRKGGGIDVYSVANRYQRLLDQHHRALEDSMEQLSSIRATTARMRAFQDELGYTAEQAEAFILREDVKVPSLPLTLQQGFGYEEYMAAWAGIDAGRSESTGETDAERMAKYQAVADEPQVSFVKDAVEGMWAWLKDFGSFAGANRRDGSEFVRFNVKMRDSVSESISNTARDSDIAGTINSMTTSTRSRSFTFAGGNVGDNAAIQALEGVVGAVKDFGMGVLDSVGLGGMANAAMGSAFTDIPQQYDSSSFSLPKISFKLELRAPYDHPLSRLTNEIVPMCMAMALGMPRQAGSQSWREPFIVEAYCRGRFQIRIGLIDSISITRAVNNLPYNYDGGYKGIDVDISIVDLSSMVAMPIATDVKFFTEDNAFTDLMAVYGSMSLSDQIYSAKKLKFHLTRQILDIKTWAGASSRANWFAGTWPGRTIQALSRVDP